MGHTILLSLARLCGWLLQQQVNRGRLETWSSLPLIATSLKVIVSMSRMPERQEKTCGLHSACLKKRRLQSSVTTHDRRRGQGNRLKGKCAKSMSSIWWANLEDYLPFLFLHLLLGASHWELSKIDPGCLTPFRARSLTCSRLPPIMLACSFRQAMQPCVSRLHDHFLLRTWARNSP